MRSDSTAPGPWLRLTALAGAAGTALVVASGGAPVTHRVLAALVVPPLVAVAIAALLAHRRLVAPSLTALALFHAALATWWLPPLHVGLAAAALAGALVSCAQSFRGERVPAGRWRDYVTLTKPRIMSLLLLTGAAGMFVGAGGVPPLGSFAAMLAGLALACGGASALNHVIDRDIDRLMGKRTERRPVAARSEERRVGKECRSRWSPYH